jgi:ribosomal protein S18 acetylase RimI-like enzyme
MPVSIRAARPDEMPLVKGLFLEYEAEINSQTGLDLAFQGFEEELSTLPGKYSPPLGVILLAELDGVPRGVVALRPLSQGIAEMKRLFVQPRARGYNLGRLLTEAVVEEARQSGYAAIRLDSLPHMQSAVALYRSLGFRDIEAYNQSSVGLIYLELTLKPPGAAHSA